MSSLSTAKVDETCEQQGEFTHARSKFQKRILNIQFISKREEAVKRVCVCVGREMRKISRESISEPMGIHRAARPVFARIISALY